MICVEPPALPELAEPQRFASNTKKHWTGRRQLGVGFLNGDSALHTYVRELLQGPWGWSAVCGMLFVFDEPEPEIRIDFTGPAASWSYLGTDALMVRDMPGYPSMNLAIRVEDLGLHTQRPVLHEFGHALGFIHGQVSPLAGELKAEQVYEYYARFGWTRAQVDAQILEPWDGEEILAIADDWHSIMYYQMPGFMWVDGEDRPGSSFISAWDAYGAELAYGPPAAPWKSLMVPFVARS